GVAGAGQPAQIIRGVARRVAAVEKLNFLENFVLARVVAIENANRVAIRENQIDAAGREDGADRGRARRDALELRGDRAGQLEQALEARSVVAGLEQVGLA